MKRFLLPLLLLTPAAAAQIGVSSLRGLAGPLASGISLAQADRGPVDDYTLDKKPLNQSNPPGPWNAGNFPNSADYSLSGLFSDVRGADLSGIAEVDAHSIGADVLPPMVETTQGSGQAAAVFNNSWLALIASFDNNAEGLVGSFLEERNDVASPVLRDTPGADLIGYYFEDSSGIGNRLPGMTVLEQTSEAMGFSGPADPDVDALDFGLGVLAHSQQTSSLLFFPNFGWYYFSLHPSCITDVNAAYTSPEAFAWNGQAYVDADACAIYKMQWIPRSGPTPGYWTGPEVHRTAAQLGLDPTSTNPVHNTDAIAINHNRLGVLLFSTHVQNDLLGVRWAQIRANILTGSNYQNLDLVDDGLLVTRHLGGVDWDDDIDALCGIDPEGGTLGTHVGTPTHEADFGHKPLGLTMTRSVTEDADTGFKLHFQVSAHQEIGSSLYVLFMTQGLDPINMTYLDPTLQWRVLAAGALGSDEGPMEWSVDPPSGMNGPNCAAVLITFDPATGNLKGGSWVTQFNL